MTPIKKVTRIVALLSVSQLLLVGAALATVPVTVTLDTTSPGRQTAVQAQFLGHDDTAGSDYDSSINTHYTSLLNIVKQMGIVHWRSGDGGSADPFFLHFLPATAASDPCVEWGGWMYNVDNEPKNQANFQHVLSNPLENQWIDVFNLGNEPDFQYEITADQYIHNQRRNPSCTPAQTYSGADYATPDPFTATADPTNGGFKARWEYLRNLTVQYAQEVGINTINFAGCNTGNIPSAADPTGSYTAVNGVPWMLQFAIDEHTRIKNATQHLYVGKAGNAAVQPWTIGSPYAVGDEVYDPKDVDPVTGMSVLYQNITSTAASENHPASQPSYWKCLEPMWVVNTTYKIGDVVRDPKDGDLLFQCILAGKSTNHPSSSTNPPMWVTGDRGQYAFPGPHQLSQQLMNPQVLTDFRAASDNSLTTASSWPTTNSQGQALPYRMGEFSPFSGPNNGLYSGTYCNGATATEVLTETGTNANCFASALAGLEMFHWWAREGCAGVDPISYTWQRNSPIYQAPYGQTGGDFFAQPYAYAYPAFTLSAQPGAGRELWGGAQPGITASTGGYNVTVYGVVAPNDLVVTIFNKTFDYDGLSDSQTMAVTINAPTGFTPTSVRTMALDSGGAAGDSTAMGAELGVRPIANNTSTFPVNWKAAGSWTGSFTINVPAFSAMIVDLQK